MSIHISTNLPDNQKDWPFKIKTPDTYTDKKKTAVLVPGEERALVLNPGDGIIYSGCDRPHWRDAMPGTPLSKKSKKLFGKKQTQEYIIIKYSSIMFYRMVKELILHGIGDRSS